MKILTISDCPNIYSGLARVHRHVIDAMIEEGHEVVACGWFTYDAKTIKEVASNKISPPRVFYKKDVRIIDVPKKADNTAMFAVWNIIDVFKPDVVITIGDYWDFWYMQAIKIRSDFAFKWIAYLTIEQDEIKDKFVGLLKFADILAAPSLYGTRILENKYQKKIEYIPYGAEKDFHRYSDEKIHQLRSERGVLDKLRFITVGQNTTRKNIPVILQAIALLADKDPEKIMNFYLHTNIGASDPQEAYIYDLIEIAEKLNVSDRISFPGKKTVSVFSSPTDDFLADEYNSSDYFLSASVCEGFGLPMLESIACGLPVIANATSTVHEMVGADKDIQFGWAERGYLIKHNIEIQPPAQMIQVVRAESMANAIWEAFCLWKGNNKKYKGISKKCIEHGKGKGWDIMKGKIAVAVKQIEGPVRIPIEIL